MKAPLISIIIPVYNAEAYLAKCIDSVLAQTMTDFEVILVNDGSQDSSGAICEEYVRKDNRISVIHQLNGGVAFAREQGVSKAIGVYSVHADPDDWIEPNMLEELYAKAVEDDADMVICDFLVEYADSVKYTSQNIKCCKPLCLLDELMYGNIHGSLCNKLIRTSLYKKFNIHFIEGIDYCEDFLVCARLFLEDIRVSYLPKAYYHYDQTVNENSITRKYTRRKMEMRLQFFNALKEIILHRSRALSHVISGIALECYYSRKLSSIEFAKVFGCYRKEFLRSKLSFKYKVKLLWKSLPIIN